MDGRYIGHAYREARGSLAPAAQGYAGEFLVLEETLRDMRSAARRVDRTAPVRLSVPRGGPLSVLEDSGYPSLRGLPALPSGALEPGATWTAPGIRALDFDDSGSFILLPFLAEYHFKGETDYRGKRALTLTARFATRWNPLGIRPSKDEGSSEAGSPGRRPVSEIVKNAAGTHDLDILVDAETLSTLFIRDRFDETFALASGSSERRSGFCLYFFEGAAPLDRAAADEAIAAATAASVAKPAIAERGPAGAGPPPGEALPPGAGPGPLDAGEGPALAEAGEPASGASAAGALDAAGLELASSPEGLVLRVRDLRFVADSDAILPSEAWRLDAIAAALKTQAGRYFLVAGHSAAVGKASGELELSIKRAKKVVDELAARGIEPSRLLYRGFGSSVPLAPNDTEEGRARNRRVEITILD